jgi:hypothetical protein
MKLLLCAIAFLVATLLIAGHAKNALPAPDPPPKLGHIKEAILKQTEHYPREVRGFFEADLVFIVGYLAVIVSLFVLTFREDPMLAYGAGLLGALAALVDAAGDIICLRYVSSLAAKSPLDSPQPQLALITTVKWSMLIGAALIFASAWLRIWTRGTDPS